MRHITRFALGLAAVALLAGPALAQQRQGSLIANKSVQEELKLTEDQVTKATEADKAVAEKRQAEMKNLTDEERRGEKGRELFRKFNEELTTKLKDVLKPEQLKRYQQIQFQQMVRRALTGGGRPGMTVEPRPLYDIPTVADALKFSDSQKEKLKAVHEDHEKRLKAAREDAGDDRQKRREATAKVTTETIEQAVKALSGEQKKKWEELYGKPFTVRFEQPGTSL